MNLLRVKTSQILQWKRRKITLWEREVWYAKQELWFSSWDAQQSEPKFLPVSSYGFCFEGILTEIGNRNSITIMRKDFATIFETLISIKHI